MTQQKHLKRRVRERMAKTGESYATARRQVARDAAPLATPDFPFVHFAGSNPATTALRILLANAGVQAPHTGEPFSEAMLLGIAGGIGAGMFAFRYEKEDFSSFFVAGRHHWDDDLTYLQNACRRLGLGTVVQETASPAAAERELRTLLAAGGPVVAWVDSASLPHRHVPEEWQGGGYHVVVIYAVDDAAGEVLLGDLAEVPVRVGLDAFAAARARIRKQKHRLLALDGQGLAEGGIDLGRVVGEGLAACHEGLTHARMSNFTLEAFRSWSERIYGGRGKDSWDSVFPRGRHLWTALTSMYRFIEHYGSGGGLVRPLFAEFLAEAAGALGDERLAELGGHYAALGRDWSALAGAALPGGVPQFEAARRLLDVQEEAVLSPDGGAESAAAAWTGLAELADAVAADFPLDEAGCAGLRQSLQAGLVALYDAEVNALREVRQAA